MKRPRAQRTTHGDMQLIEEMLGDGEGSGSESTGELIGQELAMDTATGIRLVDYLSAPPSPGDMYCPLCDYDPPMAHATLPAGHSVLPGAGFGAVGGGGGGTRGLWTAPGVPATHRITALPQLTNLSDWLDEWRGTGMEENRIIERLRMIYDARIRQLIPGQPVWTAASMTRHVLGLHVPPPAIVDIGEDLRLLRHYQLTLRANGLRFTNSRTGKTEYSPAGWRELMATLRLKAVLRQQQATFVTTAEKRGSLRPRTTVTRYGS